jgi:hypothetical protein
VIWTHLDHAQLRNEQGLLEFLQSSEPAVALARRVMAGTEDPFDSKFVDAASEIERLVQKKQDWIAHLDLLESLTWLLYRIMVAYHAVPARLRTSNVEFYYTGVGSILVKQCMRLASALFAAWDGAGRGDFAPMIRESMMPGTELQFPVLPCGLEFLHDSSDDGAQGAGLGEVDDGLPVWGDLLLLEILRRHG